MRKTIILLFSVILFSACGPSEDNKAQKYLDAAHLSFQEGNYTKAKLQIDSIKTLYPKAFKSRKAGNRFILQIEQEEQLRGLTYLDSLETSKKEEFEAIKKNYKLEKDEKYQEIGHYIIPEQVIEKNLNRSFLRFQVNEKGVMSMTSIYSGKGAIHHHTVKVTAPDGSFAETPMSNDTFVTENLGITSEKSDFKMGQDDGLINFIILNKDKSLKVTFIGDRSYNFTLHKTDIKAAVEVEKLARILHTITEIDKAREEANLKLKFVKMRMEKNDSIDNLEK
ncbi:hypothetical protein [Bacteroides sp.]|uniref:hypothetical protein n=1 Tax=Bacteroides sp. TaxID=29523 RepID=UPI00258657BB|nr:hypothetical protein [Bacteroides sp.]